jgi:hypothetical protein
MNPASPRVTQAEKKRKQERVSKELAYGQIVIVTMRWSLVLAGLLLTLWNPDPLGKLRVQIIVILMLAIANFYLQAQLLMRRPVIDQIVYSASAADLAVITVLILNGGGYDSGLYVFYFPAILAFSVAFSTQMTTLYVAVVLFFYALISLFTPGVSEDQIQIILSRLIMIAAVAFCGNLFWRIERDRRQEAKKAQRELMTEIRRRQAAPAAQTAS